jgi:IS30 family transposase
MAHHEKLSERTGLKVYFAHPHSPWERERNENTNGQLRQYLPKGECLSSYSKQLLDAIAASLNARPRKSLGWKAPAELFLPKKAFDFKKTGHHLTKSTLLQTDLAPEKRAPNSALRY